MRKIESFEEFKKRRDAMTTEEKKEESLLEASENLRSTARDLAFSKAMACMTLEIDPEDYDKAFGREYAKYSDKFMGKSAIELALIGLAEIAEAGIDVSDAVDVFRGDK